MSNVDDKKSATAKSKKEKPTKEKKIIPKYYAGTDIRKLPKVPKAFMTDLSKLEANIMTPSQRKAYLTAIIMGLIPDKFGLEVGVDQKLKAIAELNKMDESNQGTDSDESVVILDDIDITGE